MLQMVEPDVNCDYLITIFWRNIMKINSNFVMKDIDDGVLKEFK